VIRRLREGAKQKNFFDRHLEMPPKRTVEMGPASGEAFHKDDRIENMTSERDD